MILRSDCPLYKFVDDTTYSEVLTVSQTSNMQTYYNELQQWLADNFMQVNASMTKEMVIGKRTVAAPSLYTPNFQPIDRVEDFKLLGVWVSANLTWNKHVDQIISKATSRLYFLKQLRKASAPPEDMLLFYTSVIRSVLEYAAPVWHSSLTAEQKDSLESVQK